MRNLIKRADAIKAIEDLHDCPNGYSDTYDKACIIGVLEEVPTAQERKKGKWIVFPVYDSRCRRTGRHLIQCVRCGWSKEIWHSAIMPRFCENCGASMRKEATND